jgi:biotin carboxyl carrier protein
MSTYTVIIDGEELVVSFNETAGVTVNGETVRFEQSCPEMNAFSVLLNGQSCRVITHKCDNVFQTLVNAKQVDVRVESERSLLLRNYSHQETSRRARKEIRAPMPALVVRVHVEVAQEVHEGQGLVILEAMKMENELKAHQHGRVKEIYVAPGTSVEKGELIMLLE